VSTHTYTHTERNREREIERSPLVYVYSSSQQLGIPIVTHDPRGKMRLYATFKRRAVRAEPKEKRLSASSYAIHSFSPSISQLFIHFHRFNHCHFLSLAFPLYAPTRRTTKAICNATHTRSNRPLGSPASCSEQGAVCSSPHHQKEATPSEFPQICRYTTSNFDKLS
jgi:hypothetical protein